MLTVNADEHALMKMFHKPADEKRMVVILPEDSYGSWLTAKPEHSWEFMQEYTTIWHHDFIATYSFLTSGCRTAAVGTYLPLERRTFHTARAAMRPINTLLEHVFTTLEIRLENPTAPKPAWIEGACLQL